MDFSPLTIINSGKDNGDFPVSTSNKVTVPRLPDHLHYWPLQGGVYRKWFWTYVMVVDKVPGKKRPDFKDKDKEKWWAKKLLCSHQQFQRWIYQHCRLSGLHDHDVRWSGSNQTGLIIGNPCKPSQSVLNSQPFQEVLWRRQVPAAKQEGEKGFKLFTLRFPLLQT